MSIRCSCGFSIGHRHYAEQGFSSTFNTNRPETPMRFLKTSRPGRKFFVTKNQPAAPPGLTAPGWLETGQYAPGIRTAPERNVARFD
jgi:hypothetical protein